MIKGAIVNYWNTKPFLYGFNQLILKEEIQLIQAVPSVCAQKYFNNEVDFALVPVGALIGSSIKPISSYCIGATDEVYTVCLYHQGDLNAVKKIWLDTDSMTSVLLTKILCLKYWNLEVEYVPTKINYPFTINKSEAFLAIGDKNVLFKGQYNSTDLGSAWRAYSGFPFVFAVWVTSYQPEVKIENLISEAFSLGIQNLPSIISACQKESNQFPFTDYFTKYIQYNLDEPKRQGLEKFIQLAKDIHE